MKQVMVEDVIVTGGGGSGVNKANKELHGPKKSKTALLNPMAVGEDSMFLCHIAGCGKRFVRIANLEAHQLLHKGARPFKCTVEGCAAAYTRIQHLVRHSSVSHNREAGAFECSEHGCVANFDTKESLLQHFRRVHSQARNTNKGSTLACRVCQTSFPSISQLREHKTLVHNFTCQICRRRFLRESTLKLHESRHKQVETKKSKPTECLLCDVKLGNWRELLEHKKTEEHLSKQTIALTCCGKTFGDQSHFNQHVKTHEEERCVFRCTFVEGCDRFYYFEKNLRQHIKVAHQKEKHKPPKCSICDRDFCSKQRLETHMKNIHAPDPLPRKSTKHPEPEIRSDIIKKLSGKQKLSGRELLKVKKPLGGKGKRRADNSKVEIVREDQVDKDSAPRSPEMPISPI